MTGTARRSSILDVERPLLVIALVTPFDDRGEVDHFALAAHVDHLAGAGIDALMPCGTTGEGARLTDDEVSAVIATVIALPATARSSWRMSVGWRPARRSVSPSERSPTAPPR